MPEHRAARRVDLVPTIAGLGATLGLLGVTLWLVGAGEVGRRLRVVDTRWLTLTLGIFLAQFPLLAARWWLFARRLAAPLGYRRALSEYFLASLLNQVLPLGVLGDVGRAFRHARSAASPHVTPVVLAIVLERASGQVALWLVVAAILPKWWHLARLHSEWPSLGLPEGLGLLTLLALAAWVAFRRLRRSQLVRRLGKDAIRALFAPAQAALHLPLSFALLASHVLAFVAIAHGLGIDMPLWSAFHIVPLVLVVTTLPTFVAGWGVREAVLAGLYHLIGLRAADGVSIGLVYGGLSLLASAPGIVALWHRRHLPGSSS
jgi:uncharacterized membrane protein YbhN (UPF0104 family)